MKKQLTTKQILDYTEAQKQDKDSEEDKEEVLALEQVQLDKSVQIPKFVTNRTSNAFNNFLVYLCQGKLNNISDFSRLSGIPRQTIYAWLAHKDTKIAIDGMLKIQITKDTGEIYNKIKNNIDTNAAYGRLYLERYENWQPNNRYNAPIQINFNFQGTSESTPVDADVVDVDEEAP